MGRFEDALSAYDQNIADFPYDAISMANRANLLKLLGRYGDSVDAFDLLIERRPDFVRAKYSKASALIALKKYDEAERLLPSGPPATEDEWMGSYVAGLLKLKRGNLSAASRIFAQGMADAPFQRRGTFKSGWALVEIRLRHFQNAVSALGEHAEHLSSALAARCHFQIGETSAAFAALEAANDNYPTFREYASELRRLFNRTGAQTETWFDEMELELSLQAA
jgi:tetratricopeptide (TPR) repeat protein